MTSSIHAMSFDGYFLLLSSIVLDVEISFALDCALAFQALYFIEVSVIGGYHFSDRLTMNANTEISQLYHVSSSSHFL